MRALRSVLVIDMTDDADAVARGQMHRHTQQLWPLEMIYIFARMAYAHAYVYVHMYFACMAIFYVMPCITRPRFALQPNGVNDSNV